MEIKRGKTAAPCLIPGLLALMLLFSPNPASSSEGGPHHPRTAPLERLTQGRLKDFPVYRPQGAPRSFVILLSDQKGWDMDADRFARILLGQGVMVIGVDTPAFLADFEKDEDACVYPEGDLENLGRFVQAYDKLPTYYPPILVGYGSGAALVYAALAQAPSDTFGAGLSIQFSPYLPLQKPLCKGYGVEYAANSKRHGVDLLPAKGIQVPWAVLQGENDPQLAEVKKLVGQTPGAELALLPEKTPFPPRGWPEPCRHVFDSLLAKAATRILPPPPADLGGLPLIDVPVKEKGQEKDFFALLISGDGGWAKIDRDIARTLAENGVHVIGLDSLRYFWKAHTPESTADDVNKALLYYLSKLRKQRVLLLGYSQGADVLPFVINRLPPASRARVTLAAVIGLSEHAQFEFHLSSWISDSDEGLPTLPEVRRIADVPFACIYGDEEEDSPCPRLDPRKVHAVKLQGGHHFEGDYGLLAHEILKLLAKYPP